MKKIRMKNRLGGSPKKYDNSVNVVWNSKVKGPYVKSRDGNIGNNKKNKDV